MFLTLLLFFFVVWLRIVLTIFEKKFFTFVVVVVVVVGVGERNSICEASHLQVFHQFFFISFLVCLDDSNWSEHFKFAIKLVFFRMWYFFCKRKINFFAPAFGRLCRILQNERRSMSTFLKRLKTDDDDIFLICRESSYETLELAFSFSVKICTKARMERWSSLLSLSVTFSKKF